LFYNYFKNRLHNLYKQAICWKQFLVFKKSIYKLSAIVYFRYVFSDFVIMSSYMHFHSLYCPLCTIITIICLVIRMLINIGWHLTIGPRVHASHLSWLFTIIECFQHTSIWASLWQYKVVLEYPILSIVLSTIDWADYLWSIIL